jgi:hypothetical protein
LQSIRTNPEATHAHQKQVQTARQFMRLSGVHFGVLCVPMKLMGSKPHSKQIAYNELYRA